MPQEKKVVDKFKLIEAFGVMQKAIEDDLVDVGKISFSKTKTGSFYCTVVYHEVEKVKVVDQGVKNDGKLDETA